MGQALNKKDLEKYELIIQSEENGDILRASGRVKIAMKSGSEKHKLLHFFTGYDIVEAMEDYVKKVTGRFQAIP